MTSILPDPTDSYSVKPRFSNYRCDDYSDMHRIAFGWNAPLCDIDVTTMATEQESESVTWNEYDYGRPKMLVETKKWNCPVFSLSHPSIQANKWLADCAKIPFVVAVYYPENWLFYVIPINDEAKFYVGNEPVYMSQRTYGRFLAHVRNRQLPADLLGKLNRSTTIPDGCSPPNYLP